MGASPGAFSTHQSKQKEHIVKPVFKPNATIKLTGFIQNHVSLEPIKIRARRGLWHSRPEFALIKYGLHVFPCHEKSFLIAKVLYPGFLAHSAALEQ
jgi:hypothetical protein